MTTTSAVAPTPFPTLLLVSAAGINTAVASAASGTFNDTAYSWAWRGTGSVRLTAWFYVEIGTVLDRGNQQQVCAFRAVIREIPDPWKVRLSRFK